LTSLWSQESMEGVGADSSCSGNLNTKNRVGGSLHPPFTPGLEEQGYFGLHPENWPEYVRVMTGS